MRGQRGWRRRQRAAEAGMQAPGGADDLLRAHHPAHLRPLLRARRLPRRARADRGPGSDRGGRLQPVGERALDPAATVEAGQARRPERQLPGAQDPGRTEHLGRADAERLPWCAGRRRAVPHARRDRGHRPVDHRVRPQQLIPLLGALAVLAAGAARAEPYLMVREGAKCSACHTNQTGGGKRTAFAHIHAHDIEHDLDLLPVPAGVKPFNGELNSYASIGGDLRVQNTTIFQDRPDRLGRVPTNEAFRRSVRSNDSRLFEFLVYGQVDLLPDFVTLYADEDFTSGATNREAFGMIRGFLPWDTYVKAGRLFPAYSLRVQDDQAFIRARTGYTFQTPDEGGEIGIQPGAQRQVRRLRRGRLPPLRLAQPARHLRVREGDARPRPDPLRDRRRAIREPRDPAPHPVPHQQRHRLAAEPEPGRALARAALLPVAATSPPRRRSPASRSG